MQKRKQFGLASASTLFFLLLTGVASGQDDSRDISQLSLDQLGQVQVTSVSKKSQKLEDTAAAIYVITQRDIRNSTATSIPELLRTVPGLDVARINGTHWAISARGFAEQYSDKMLVLIDGRSVFDPLFPGLFWNEQDLMLEDIERIEVIRGPGATLWGSNAVNGVINIITKPAQETTGALITASAGDKERSSSAIRYGGKLGQSAYYRVYSKYYDHGPSLGLTSGLPAHDSARSISGGFRLDATTSRRDSFMLSGKAFGGKAGLDSPGVSYTPPFVSSYVDFLDTGGENLLASWTHESLNGQKTVVQTSYAHVLRPQLGVDVNGNTASASIQHERALGSRHNLVMGLGYDFGSAHTSFTIPTIWWDPANSSYHTGSGFIQDEMLFVNGTVRLTTGLRLDRNTLSDLALQPNVRVLWKVNSVNSLWASYSLAHELASLDSAHLRATLAIFPGPAGLVVARVIGNPDLKPTKLNAYEVGYRVQPSKRLSLDLATFYNSYSDLFGVAPGTPFFEAGPPPRFVQPLVIQNNNSLRSFGGELALKWVPSRNLQFGAGYSFIRLDAAASQLPGLVQAGQTPRHKLETDSHINLSHAVSLNSLLSFVDRRPVGPVAGYTQLDTMLVWRPVSSTELSIGARDLFNKEHLEFMSQQGAVPTVFGRSVVGKVTWNMGER